MREADFPPPSFALPVLNAAHSLRIAVEAGVRSRTRHVGIIQLLDRNREVRVLAVNASAKPRARREDGFGIASVAIARRRPRKSAEIAQAMCREIQPLSALTEEQILPARDSARIGQRHESRN